jgi:hypothetical protein
VFFIAKTIRYLILARIMRYFPARAMAPDSPNINPAQAGVADKKVPEREAVQGFHALHGLWSNGIVTLPLIS